MSRRIIGATVGTPMKPQSLIEKTEQAEQIKKNKEDIENLSKDVEDIKKNGIGGSGGGTGSDGFSPIATVTETENGALIEITDKNGKTSATVENGEDGFSPLINVSTLPNGYLVLIQTKDGAKTMEILNGEDGVSPLVSVSEGNGGHSVTIQDRFGNNTFFVADGEDGYTPRKNFDYFDGKDGVGIQEIATLSESKADDGYSWYEIILTNGIRKQFSVKNGSKGSKGDDATVTTANIINALGYTPANETHDHMGVYDNVGEALIQTAKHNIASDSHNDIRLLIEGLTTRLNALANSTDEDLDQMAEIVAYIKSNKSLIDSITTTKVSVSDIIDNLTTSVANKPLSAKQGVVLKALIDAIVVPTKTSQLTNDSNFLTSIPSEYVTDTELNAKGYQTSEQVQNAINTAIIGAIEGGY